MLTGVLSPDFFVIMWTLSPLAMGCNGSKLINQSLRVINPKFIKYLEHFVVCFMFVTKPFPHHHVLILK